MSMAFCLIQSDPCRDSGLWLASVEATRPLCLENLEHLFSHGMLVLHGELKRGHLGFKRSRAFLALNEFILHGEDSVVYDV